MIRGPAPSIICPRCGLAAPPSDLIAPFTTCTGCGLSFESSPKERAVRPSRPPPKPEVEPEPLRHRGLRWYQAVGIVVALVVAGSIKYEYSWRYRGDREKLEAIERDNQRDAERHQRSLDRIHEVGSHIKTGIASCDAMIGFQFAPIEYPTDDATAEVRKVFQTGYDTMSTAKSATEMDQLCTKALADVAAARKRVDCSADPGDVRR